MTTRLPEAEVFLFDMDNTLIDADCDETWKHFAVRHGLAPEAALAQTEQFMRQYDAGKLDLAAFFDFQFREFVGLTEAEGRELSRKHFEEFIRPRMRRDAAACVEAVKRAGKPLALLSSTITTLSAPVAEAFGIATVIGPALELAGGRFTGRLTGRYTAGEEKVPAGREFAEAAGSSLARTAAYGDSINDRFLLAACGFPVAVNPGDALRSLAMERRWPIVQWN